MASSSEGSAGCSESIMWNCASDNSYGWWWDVGSIGEMVGTESVQAC